VWKWGWAWLEFRIQPAALQPLWITSLRSGSRVKLNFR
jgi:hypothetical protein